MQQQIRKGDRVVRLASPDDYPVGAGTYGVVTHIYDLGAEVGYQVFWEGHNSGLFAAGSRVRHVSTALASPRTIQTDVAGA